MQGPKTNAKRTTADNALVASRLAFTDGFHRSVFEDDEGQYIMDAEGQRVYGQWLPPEDFLPLIVENSVLLPPKGRPYNCPCCRCRTLDARGASDICPVCYWEDDGQDDQDAEVVRGGPNGSLILAGARKNYQRFGACAESMLENVRPPLSGELPSQG